MDTAGQEIVKIETRLRQLRTKLDRLVAKADEPGAEVKPDYREQLKSASDSHAVVLSKLSAFRAGRGRKWDDFRPDVEIAWQDFDKALRALNS